MGSHPYRNCKKRSDPSVYKLNNHHICLLKIQVYDIQFCFQDPSRMMNFNEIFLPSKYYSQQTPIFLNCDMILSITIISEEYLTCQIVLLSFTTIEAAVIIC